MKLRINYDRQVQRVMEAQGLSREDALYQVITRSWEALQYLMQRASR